MIKKKIKAREYYESKKQYSNYKKKFLSLSKYRALTLSSHGCNFEETFLKINFSELLISDLIENILYFFLGCNYDVII